LLLASEKTLSPPEIAHAIAGDGGLAQSAGSDPTICGQLALAGRLIIYRKGKPVDPNDFRGVYRLGLRGTISFRSSNLVSPAGNDIHVIGNYFVGGPETARCFSPLANTQ